jgi:hypothetical protein
MSAIKVNTITPLSGTHTSGSFNGVFSGSIVSDRIDKLEIFSSSLDTAFATDEQLYQLYQATASLQQFSSSIQSEVNAIKAWTASLELINTIDTELLQILQTTASLNSKTGSYATTGSNVFSGNQTISDSLIVSEIVSTTAPAEGDIASAGETGITYLTGDLTKWAIFREDAFTIGVWTDVVAGWGVTDNDGFTDIIAGRGSFGAASFQTTANNWPAPASGRTYVFTSPDYQPESANPLEITIGNNDWVFGVGGDLDVPANINGAPNLATTGSNTFNGTNIFSGSLKVSGSVKFHTTNTSNDSLDLIIGQTNDLGPHAYQINASGSTENALFLISNLASVMVAQGTVSNPGDTSLFTNQVVGYVNNGGPEAQLQLSKSGSVPAIWVYDYTATSNFPGDINIGYDNIIGTTSGSLNIRNGNINLTGSLNVSGSIYKDGNKQFNYGQWSSLETQTGSANTAYAMKLEVPVPEFEGIYVGNNGSGFPTRIYVENNGVYNIQFSAQLHTTANEACDFSVWFAMTGSNIMDSNTDFSIEKVSGGGFDVAALNFLTPISSGSYVELYWSKTTANGQLQAKGIQSTPTRPATPSVIVTVTQVA